MPRFAALLRGINVGGHRVTKGELVQIVEDAGFSEVATWRASGNLLLTSSTRSPEEVESTLETALGVGLGYSVPVLVRDRDALRTVVETDPFVGLEGRGRHQVIFLRREPDSDVWAQFLALLGPDEAVRRMGREIHWSPSQGVSDSGLDVVKVERLLAPTTMRGMNTVREIEERLA